MNFFMKKIFFRWLLTIRLIKYVEIYCDEIIRIYMKNILRLLWCLMGLYINFNCSSSEKDQLGIINYLHTYSFLIYVFVSFWPYLDAFKR